MNLRTGGNRSWDCEVRIGGERKSIYLGTNERVTLLLDQIEGKSEFWNELNPISRVEHYDKIKNRLIELVTPLIEKEMIEFFKNEGFEGWKTHKIEGQKYLKKLYKESPYYVVPVKKEKKESKGFYIGEINGVPTYKKRKKKSE